VEEPLFSQEFPKEVETLRHPAPPEELTQRLMGLRSDQPHAHPHELALLLNVPSVGGREVKAWLPWIDAALDEFSDPCHTCA
jgi:hypothetical protein